ncbi:type II toxin-antitoxin system RelE family toxin [Ureibacillus sinduriensis]|uniref:Addiction module toxin RelE n=1 Tax=Ureibacillus sinduriensis BLB-1 = JCM 15800 TaxID=1384057 RepID=A0A0A3HU18_9BACL|nr:type II toxin-antitoxin system RelE/ParE family toxin [Ureibacillus sinduriensis]KGR74715.1 hypothetical protein CD33_16690 [Ureibacillus sinduriensis BLB-1 = JCM 15800]
MEPLKDLFSNLEFYDEAVDEWQSLDGHQKKFVSKALEKIEALGNEIGEPLGNKRDVNLTGYRKVKLKQIGIRIVYRVVNEVIEITEIIAIGGRADEEVYQDAYDRIQKRITADTTNQ